MLLTSTEFTRLHLKHVILRGISLIRALNSIINEQKHTCKSLPFFVSEQTILNTQAIGFYGNYPGIKYKTVSKVGGIPYETMVLNEGRLYWQAMQ